METRGGSLRLRGCDMHSGKCGFRAITLRPEEWTQDGARASLRVWSRLLPGLWAPFPGAVGAGAAAEA